MSTVHRLLDEAFADVPLTPEIQDLKEEIRASLVDRATELEGGGVPPEQAARRALDELGDVEALVVELSGTHDDARRDAGTATTAPGLADAAALHARHRVRPAPAFVVGVTSAGVVGAAAVVALVLVLAGVLGTPGAAVALGLSALAALAAGWVVAASLAQETTTNHPLPARRSAGYGAATGATVLGLGVVATALVDDGPASGTALLVAGAALVLLAVLGFTWLGVTQTNRRKAWTREAARLHTPDDRFSKDPAAAARFGLYAAAIWGAVFVVFVVLRATVDWRGSWLVFVAGWVVMLLVLARMQFGGRREK